MHNIFYTKQKKTNNFLTMKHEDALCHYLIHRCLGLNMECLLQQNLGLGVSREDASGCSVGAGPGDRGDHGDRGSGGGGCGVGGSGSVVFWLLLKPDPIQPRLTWHSLYSPCWPVNLCPSVSAS